MPSTKRQPINPSAASIPEIEMPTPDVQVPPRTPYEKAPSMERRDAYHAEIAALAHRYWLERGSPIDSSPDIDWFRAEEEIRSRKAAA